MTQPGQGLSAEAHTVPAMQQQGEHRHHPWRAFRDLVDWTLEWAHLPHGVWGYTDYSTKTVTLKLGMSQAERRCTIEHERWHIVRGPAPVALEVREEAIVDQNAARALLPDIRAIGEALAWSGSQVDEAADELWVDRPTLRVRLEHLHPSEKAYLRRRLEEHDDGSAAAG